MPTPPPPFRFPRCIVTAAFTAESFGMQLYGSLFHTELRVGWWGREAGSKERKERRKGKKFVCEQTAYHLDSEQAEGLMGRRKALLGYFYTEQGQEKGGAWEGWLRLAALTKSMMWAAGCSGDPDSLEQMRQLVSCCQPEAAASRNQCQSPCRVYDYPSSWVHQHIFSFQCSDFVLTFYAVSICSH